MTEEEREDTVADSEQVDVETQEDNQEEEQREEQKMVPLAALQAERRKRQETEARNRVYEEMMNRKTAEEPEEEDDPEALLTKASYKQETSLTKREILEQVYQDMNPESVQKINMYLKPILDKKPWLAATVDTSVNRLARAAEIVEDYMHLVEEKPRSKATSDAKRIIENSKKPGSPTQVGKSAQPTGTEYLKSIQGKKEFREYRQKLLRGEA